MKPKRNNHSNPANLSKALVLVLATASAVYTNFSVNRSLNLMTKQYIQGEIDLYPATQMPLTHNQNNPGNERYYLMSVMINYESLAFGLAELDGWGVEGCSSKAPAPPLTSCVYQPASRNPNGLDWNHQKFLTFDTLTYFPLYPGHEITTSQGRGAKALGVDVPVNKFMYNEAGVLGLSPQSTFWDYVKAQGVVTGDFVYTSLWLTTNDTFWWYDLFGDKSENVFSNSELRISDDLNKVVDLVREDEVFIPSTAKQWGVQNVEVFSTENETKPIYTGELCFTSNAQATVLTTTPNHFINRTLYETCRSDRCGQDSFILNGPSLMVKFKDENNQTIKTVQVTPNQYIYQNASDEVLISVEDIRNYQGGAGCSPNAQFGFGRMFMFFNQLVLKKDLSGDEDNQIAIFDYAYRPSLAKQANVGSLVAAGLIFTFGILICIQTLRWKGIMEAKGKIDVFATGSSQASPVKNRFLIDDDEDPADTLAMNTIGADTRLKQSKKTDQGNLEV